MSFYFELPDFEKLFQETANPIILNDVPYITEADRANFNSLIMTNYQDDILPSIPSCSCGELKSGFFIDDQGNGQICPSCDTPVEYPAEGDLTLRTWLRVPEGVKGFICPVVYVQLTNLLNSKGYNLLEWMIRPNSIPPSNCSKKTMKRISDLEVMGWRRGLNNFIEQFDQFLVILTQYVRVEDIEYLEYLRANKDKIFPTVLPMPNKAMIITQDSQHGFRADNRTVIGAIEAARTIASISIPMVRPHSIKRLEDKTLSIIINLVKYYQAALKNNIGSKKGWLRFQVFCSRSHHCARGVITSNSKPHYYQALPIPWSQGLEIFKIHILNILHNRYNYSLPQAYSFIEQHINQYNEGLDVLIKDLIANAPKIKYIMKFDYSYLLELGYEQPQVDSLKMPESGFPSAFQRNPSLKRQSTQFFYITEVKNDIQDKTISLSVLATKGPNADSILINKLI